MRRRGSEGRAGAWDSRFRALPKPVFGDLHLADDCDQGAHQFVRGPDRPAVAAERDTEHALAIPFAEPDEGPAASM